ncbi:hypothetical protein GCM10020331_052210 [Ectobacillus funiculus]
MFHKDGDSYIRVTATVEADQLSVISTEINTALFGEKPGKRAGLSRGSGYICRRCEYAAG